VDKNAYPASLRSLPRLRRPVNEPAKLALNPKQPPQGGLKNGLPGKR